MTDPNPDSNAAKSRIPVSCIYCLPQISLMFHIILCSIDCKVLHVFRGAPPGPRGATDEGGDQRVLPACSNGSCPNRRGSPGRLQASGLLRVHRHRRGGGPQVNV